MPSVSSVAPGLPSLLTQSWIVPRSASFVKYAIFEPSGENLGLRTLAVIASAFVAVPVARSTSHKRPQNRLPTARIFLPSGDQTGSVRNGGTPAGCRDLISFVTTS